MLMPTLRNWEYFDADDQSEFTKEERFIIRDLFDRTGELLYYKNPTWGMYQQYIFITLVKWLWDYRKFQTPFFSYKDKSFNSLLEMKEKNPKLFKLAFSKYHKLAYKIYYRLIEVVHTTRR